jgi:hypothetical protein
MIDLLNINKPKSPPKKEKIMKTFLFFCLLFLAIVVGPKVSSWFSSPVKSSFNSQGYLAKTNNATLVPIVHKKYGELICQICREEKVSSRISGAVIEKVIIIESSCRPKAKKAGDGIGLMGVEPSTAIAYKVSLDSLEIPYWNLRAGIKHLNAMVDSLHGNVPAALIAYNCGLGKYRKNYLAAGINPKQAKYYQKVKTLLDVKQFALN